MAVRLCVAVVFAALLVAGAEGQTQDCTSAYTNLTACLTYISGPDTTPLQACCIGINDLNTNNADCLCQIVQQFSNGTTPGVNVTKAYALPSQCGVVVDTAKCPALALPPGAAVAPTPPYLSSPNPSPGGATGPATGSATGPATAPGSSAASAIRASPLTASVALLGAALGAAHLLWSVRPPT